MTLTTHAVMGAVIGQTFANPVVSFVVGFVVHLMVDMIPHGDCYMAENFRVHKHKRKRAVAYVMTDAILALSFIMFLFNVKDIVSIRNFTWGVFGSVLPDLMVGMYDITKSRYLKWFFDLHFTFHNFWVKRKGDVPLYYALLAQLVLVLFLSSKL